MAAAARLFDADPDLYRWVYPAIGVIAVLSLLPAGRMRIRGERRELERFRAHQARRGAADGASGRGLLAGLAEALAILRRDRGFARYCQAQYLLGSAALMMDAILTIVISSELGVQYLGATLLLDLIPQATLLLQLPFWSGHFDRYGLRAFRGVNRPVWLAGPHHPFPGGALGAEVAPRPGGAVTAVGERDQARVQVREGFGGQAPVAQHPRGEVLDQDVADHEQFPQQRAAVLGGQVAHEGAFAPVEDLERAAAVPRLVAAVVVDQRAPGHPGRVQPGRALDLDHVGAQVREQSAHVRSGDDVGQVQDAQPAQRQRPGCTWSASPRRPHPAQTPPCPVP